MTAVVTVAALSTVGCPSQPKGMDRLMAGISRVMDMVTMGIRDREGIRPVTVGRVGTTRVTLIITPALFNVLASIFITCAVITNFIVPGIRTN